MIKIFFKSFLGCLGVLLLNYSLIAQGNVRYPIIPKPAKLVSRDGYFKFTSKTKIVLGSENPELKIAASYLVKLIKNSTNLLLPYTRVKTKENTIFFYLDNGILNEEGYILKIAPSFITLHAKTPKGVFYAIQTLRQLMPAEIESKDSNLKSFLIPAVEIEDAPRFNYRGGMLDVARHFFPIEFLKKYIDLLAFYKINTFHLHLNDDQGWRVEIKRYPKLNEIGAWRKETLIGHRSDRPEKFDGTPHGGYYTQKELKELVQYAGDRFITIIPEIDIPGHSQAILAAYPQLGCIDSTYQVSTKWGVHNNILCPTEETFDFLKNVFSEVISIFPSKYIHIGGDEVPKDRWKKSAFCQDLIKRFNLKDEHGLQSYFIQRVEIFLNSKDRNIIGWDEILEGGLAPNASVMSWRGENGGIAAVRQKHFAIMTPSAYTYINFYQTKNTKQEPFSHPGFLPLEKVYSYNPVPPALLQEEAKYILGTQACLWTEYVINERDAEFKTFPRLCALAEVGWTPSSSKNYIDFLERLNQNLKHLGEMNVNYAKFYQINK